MGKSTHKRRPQIAVVMSGGGLKPLAAIPLFDFLDQEGIVPDLLVGCSGGSIMAAMRASGYSCGEIEDIARNRIRPDFFKRDWRTLLGVLHLPFGRFDRTAGLFKPDRLMALFDSLFQERRIEELPTKIIIQATDYETGDGVSLEQGHLAQAVYASSAIHPFFPAIRIDGRWLFDGLYSGPLPLLPALKHDMDIIIAIEFMEKIQVEPKGFYENMVHLNKIFTKTIMQSQTTISMALHHYEIIYIKVIFEKYINLWDTDALTLIIDAGKAAVKENIPHIISAIDNWDKTSSHD